jgi:hypothetical protein
VPTCAANLGLVRLPSKVAGASATLVPGAPKGAVSCVYGQVGGRFPSKLISHREVSALVGPLRSILNALPRVPPGVVYSCPFDNNRQVLLLFTYRGDKGVTVQVHLTGCQMASNGSGRARTTAEARSSLARLLGVEFGPS